MANLVDITSAIVDSIDRTVKVLDIDVLKIYVCSTAYITVTKIVEDEFSNQYKVIDFLYNEWIEVTPIGGAPDPYIGTVVIAPVPLFLHGTPSSTNFEYVKLEGQKTLDKTPLIWLLESYEYDNLPPDSSVVASYDLRLFLMDWCNEPKWRNADHNELVIKPMESLAELFLDVVREDYAFKTLGTYRIRPRSRFGVEVTNKGNTKKIIDEDFSGVEMNVTLELFDVSFCNVNC